MYMHVVHCMFVLLLSISIFDFLGVEGFGLTMHMHMYMYMYVYTCIYVYMYMYLYTYTFLLCRYFPFQLSYWLDWLPMYASKRKPKSRASLSGQSVLQDRDDQDSSTEEEEDVPLMTAATVRYMDKL